jgi:hypothetical protein
MICLLSGVGLKTFPLQLFRQQLAVADGKDDDDAVGSSIHFFVFDYPTVSIYVHCRFPRPAGLLFGIGGIVSIYTNFVKPLDK